MEINTLFFSRTNELKKTPFHLNGEYYYVSPTCTIKDSTDIKVKGPKYKSKLAKTEKF